ncbi:MAG: DNA polymerase III subunit alpha, partial [Deferribacteraceae bacterium]|nr:DNA polymerase III subunit alpha [Deferribacteraceae bacterium]
MDFVHLHLHTQYSLADGAIIIGNLIPRVKSLGMKSVAITDHGYMYGAVDFYNACKEADIKPVLGCEAYISPNSRHERKYDEGDMKYYHLILLAENNKGFYNLSKLASIANTEGFYYKPRIDKEVLAQYSEGIIVLSACMSGEIPKKILSGNYKAAKEAALEYRDIMGDGNFFLEIQYNELPEQNIINTQLINISKETGIPLVATCDCHYLDRDDRESHDILRCIQHSELFDREKYQNDPPSSLYFKSAEEVSAYFRDCPEAVENTVKIAERCNVTIGSDRLHLPVYDVPAPHTPESYFRHLAEEGLNGHLKLVPPEKHEEYYKRLNMEMDVIEMKGYVGYYLIVWDFINYARRNGITVGPGRGSGAGSLAAYSLGITDIDPIKLNLLFERFLNPERSSPPDFDIDFCVRRRDEVFQYVREKYGKDNISQIVTFSRLSGRGVIRDVCRALAIPLATADRLAKAIPEVPGITLAEALKDDPSIENTIKAVDKGAELLKHSLKLEGLLRQAGTHPAGVVIADKPPDEYVPLCRGKNEEVQVQYEAEHIENLGLVKFDLLGLATLTIIDDAVKRVRHDIEPSFDISAIPFDDPKVYEMLANGESTGVFQLESSGMRSLMKRLRPSSLEDITALNALYRPGPIGSGMLDLFCDRKHGRQPVTYPLPQLKSILTETYGVILYQEQVMEIARVAAGYSLGAADILRKAMGKKKADVMQRQQAVFTDGDEKLGIPGARSLGITAEKAKEIFSLMEKFAEYGFNKSHSAAYAVLAYRTAYLRCNF